MGIDFKNAARRHHQSAELLYQKDFWGDADHLYRFSAECVLKAIMIALNAQNKSGDLKKDRHRQHINVLWNEYNSFVNGRNNAGYALSGPNPFADWDIAQRYAGSKDFSRELVEPHRNAIAPLFKLLDKARV